MTEAVRRRPYSVILLDEIEKAHPDVMNLFYQVFDKGVLADGEGKDIDFSNTIIFMTSNLAAEILVTTHRNDDYEKCMTAVCPYLSEHLSPALLARMTVILYRPLEKTVLAEIVRMKLNQIANRLKHHGKAKLSYTASVVQQLSERCTEIESGARHIDCILQGKVMPFIAKEILVRLHGNVSDTLRMVTLDIDSMGDIEVHFQDEN